MSIFLLLMLEGKLGLITKIYRPVAMGKENPQEISFGALTNWRNTMAIVSVNITISADPSDIREQLQACFAAKRLVNLETENHFDAIIDLLDNILTKANKAAEARGHGY